MAITWLVTKCPLVDRIMYGYHMAGHEVSPGWWAHLWILPGWARSVPWLMGSCMAITWLVMKCPIFYVLMYDYDMAGHEVTPGWLAYVWLLGCFLWSVPCFMGSYMGMTWLVTKCPLVDGFMYGYDIASHEKSPGWLAYVWLWHGLSRSVP